MIEGDGSKKCCTEVVKCPVSGLFRCSRWCGTSGSPGVRPYPGIVRALVPALVVPCRGWAGIFLGGRIGNGIPGRRCGIPPDHARNMSRVVLDGAMGPGRTTSVDHFIRFAGRMPKTAIMLMGCGPENRMK